ncbi:MAG: glycosyltransferase family 10 [Patescibacteria group bacterium]
MQKIKLTTASPEWPIERQTPNSKGIWENYHFSINKNIEKCDYWIILGGLVQKESCICPKKNTIFITTEPKNIKKYNSNFLKQFETIITSQRNIKHPNILNKQESLPWMIGAEYNKEINTWGNFSKNYDNLKSSQEIKKSRLISVISSNKNSTKGHRQRLKFINKLKKHFGNKIDILGKDIKDFTDKWDIIAPYKYHIVLENSSNRDYWSEKLSDAFLGESYPLYYGCSNIYEYFPKNSLSVIDIKKPREAIKIIEDTLKNNTYEKSKGEIIQSKELILDEYNLFPMITKIIKKTSSGEPLRYEILEINPENNYPPTIKEIMLKKLKLFLLKIKLISKLFVKKILFNKFANYLKNQLIILIWLTRGKPTPPPHVIKQKNIKKYARKYRIKTFIETGTYKGKMVEAMEKMFKKIYSIELDISLYRKAVDKFKQNTNILILNGDSGEILPSILKEINEPCLFWLDGHYSGDITAKGNLNTPIFKELTAIFNHPIKNHVILIDDARCFVGENDYPTISKLKEFIKNKNKNLKFKVKNDIISIC